VTWREWTAGASMRAALGALLLGAGAIVWTLVVALRPDEVRPAPAAVTITPGALDTPAAPPLVDVVAAVATDLFATNRAAPAVRYHAPGEVLVTGPAAPQEPPKPVVLGTALAADGSSFATCQFASSRLLMVRVGDRVGNYVVKSIERGSVVFTTPEGKRLEIFAPRPGS
jgi:hypothetical protein